MGSQPLQQLLQKRYSRREILERGLRLGAAGVALSALPIRVAQAAGGSLGFTPIQHALSATHITALGYHTSVLVRWGDALVDGIGEFNPMQQSPEDQAKRFGYNNDFVAYFPIAKPLVGERGLLCVNHEYPSRSLMFPEMDTELAARIEMEAVGMSVVEIERSRNGWKYVPGSSYNRRITATTPMRLSGPAAGHARLQTSADKTGSEVRGTFANCAGGTTPWGTCLSAEENFNMYFGGKLKSDHRETRQHVALGVGKEDQSQWRRADTRFDVGVEPNEPNRFGWIVEVDPYDPASVPRKRTALGRFKHECATCTLTADGRVAVYSGDDEAFQFLYRYLSNGKVQKGGLQENKTLLDDGTLHAAKFYENGELEWLPIVFGRGPLVPENGFTSQADVLIETRKAAALLGATPMDRPEDVEANPVNNHVYVALTNNVQRKSPDIANPHAPNLYGHVLELTPPDGDHGASRYKWDLFLTGGDNGQDNTHSGWITSPDNFAFDNKGNIWISTDGMQRSSSVCDGIYAAATSGPERALLKQFFSGPLGSEMCGPCFTPDNTSFFAAVQHPGEGRNSSFEEPLTRWPDFRELMPPRPSVVVITKEDGGVIGS